MDTYAYMKYSEKQGVNQPSRKKEINCYLGRDPWPENIKHEFMWFLFQEILTFTVNNVNPQSDYQLFLSMLKVFSMFELQVQCYGDELSEVCI